MVWLSVVLAGITLALVVSVLAWPAALSGPVPNTSLSPALRLLWPWVRVLAKPCERLASWSHRERLKRRLHLAGLSHVLQVAELAALQWCSALFCALFAGMIAQMLDATLFLTGTLCLAGAVCGYAFPGLWLNGLKAKRQAQMLRELPFMLDMTTLCVQAGLNLHGALLQAVQYGPEGPLRQELQRAMGDIRAGMPRLQALDAMADRTSLAQVQSLVLALRQADQLGMSLAPLLKSQSAQRQAERFQRAEKLALQAPVKMLFPMVVCIFPCTFLVIGFPVLYRFTQVSF